MSVRYTNTNEPIKYTLGGGPKVTITFTSLANGTKVVENFDAESQNPVEMQQNGWQAILDNYKKHAPSVEENKS